MQLINRPEVLWHSSHCGWSEGTPAGAPGAVCLVRPQSEDHDGFLGWGRIRAAWGFENP